LPRLLDGDHDFSAGVSVTEIPERFGRLTQLVLAVDDRCHRSGVEKLPEDHEIRFVDLRQERSRNAAAATDRSKA